jgi:ribosomal protein S27E
MTDKWTLVDNPAWAGVKPDHLEHSGCHDGSHCVTIRCDCGNEMHLHESETKRVAGHLSIAAVCRGCGDLLTFPPGSIANAFAEMRRQGWII